MDRIVDRPAVLAGQDRPKTFYIARLTSFGYLHGAAPEASLVLDLRDVLYDPHFDPALRELTALDPRVLEHVAGTPGAQQILDQLVQLVHTFGAYTRAARTPLWDELRVSVAFGCAGGRHRSAGLAILASRVLAAEGWRVEVTHRDIDRPVVHRDRSGR